jgi:hypothetical protein
MADSVDQIDLTVYGGVETVDLSVDFGSQGDRGSQIFAGSGDPVTYLASQDVLLNDLYINTSTSSQYYGWLYQYLLEVGNPAWTPILQLNPSQFSQISTTTFSTGSTTIVVPVTNLTANTTVGVDDFIIRYSIKNADPVASGFTYSITGSGSSQNISIVINGASFSGGTWSSLTGSQDVHLFISYKV